MLVASIRPCDLPVFKFPPPATDYFSQVDTPLKGHTKLVQALRGFVARFTILLYTHKQWEIVSAKIRQSGAAMNADDGVMYWFLEHRLRNSVLLDLRALCDGDPKSLGAKSIADGLNDAESRAGLCLYLDGVVCERRLSDVAMRDRYLNYVAKYAALLSTNAKRGEEPHVLVMKALLVRRWANKTVAHPTLDNYNVHVRDFHDVFVAVGVLATAIEAVMGDAGCSTDLLACEEQAERGGAALFEFAYETGNRYIRKFRELLPIWVSSGEEFPEYTFE